MENPDFKIGAVMVGNARMVLFKGKAGDMEPRAGEEEENVGLDITSKISF